MKLPSIPYLFEEFVGVCRRFPLVMFTAIVGTIAAIILIEGSTDATEKILEKMLMSAVLGIPLFLSAAIAVEKWQLKGVNKWLPSIAAAALVLVYYLSLNIGKYGPSNPAIIRFIGLALAAQLLVAYLPYLDKTPIADFWEYNKRLFGHLAVGIFYSLVLFAGLSVAILAVDNLFDLHIDGEIYGQLFALIGGIFNTAYFLAHFPREFSFSSEEENAEVALSDEPVLYTSAFKNLTKFILIPIVGIYFLILYAFSAKILLTWELPQGWVSKLVLGFSVAGIFTYLLNYMLVKIDGGKLVCNYRRSFFYILLPMVLLLFVAIGRRVSDNGVTEARFIVMSTGAWLLLLSLYFIISKKDNIKFIPLSLSIFSLLTVLGPFNAFNVSARSQVHRLEMILTKHSMLADGKVVPAKDSLSGTDAESARSILFYLQEFEHFDKVAPLFGFVPGETPEWGEIDKIASNLNIGYSTVASSECYASFPYVQGLNLQGYEVMFTVFVDEYATPDSLMSFRLSKDRQGLDFLEKGKFADHFDLQPYLQKIAKKYNCSRDTFEGEDALYEIAGASYEVRFVTQNMNFVKGDTFKIRNWNGIILLKKKK